MPPMPPGPNAAEILQGLWEETLEPADLTRRSLELKQLSTQLAATAEDGLAKTRYLLNNHGQGALAEVICQAWTEYWVKVAIVSAQVLQSSACLDAWATTLGSMLFNMTGVVESAEAMIRALEAARPIMETLYGIDVDAEIQTIKEQAQEDVRALSTAAMGALAAVPSWAGQVPAGMSTPGGGGMSSSAAGPASQGGQQPSTTSASDSTTGPSPEGGSTTTTTAPASNSTQGPTPGNGTGAETQPSVTPTSSSTAGPSPNGVAQPALGSQPASSSTPAPGGSGVGGGSSVAPGSSTPTSGAGGGGAAGTTSSPGSAPNPTSSAGSSPAASTPAPGEAPSASSTAAPSTASPPATASESSAGAAAASSGSAPGGSTSPSAAGSPAAGVAPMSGVVSPAAAAGGAPSPALPPVSAAASPIASAAAGAVPPPPPVPPPAPSTSLSPVSPGSSLAPPPPAAAVPPPAAPGVHAPAAPGPGPANPASSPPPQSANPGSSASPTSATPPPNAAASASQSTQQGQPDGPTTADRGGAATPVVPLSSAHDPVIAPAFIAPVAPPGPAHTFDEDLAAVRVLVESTGGFPHVNWAAGTVVAGGRKLIVVTTDRGRGWMPAGTILPANVELPWRHPASSRWEGLFDPGRVIVEYAAAVGGALTALASTQFSAPRGAGNVPFVPVIDPSAQPHPELLGTVPLLRGDTASRSVLQVNPDLVAKIQAISNDENSQHGRAVGCAYRAIEHADAISGGAVAHARICRRVLDQINDEPGRNPRRIDQQLRPLWEELEDAHATLLDRERAVRADVRDVPVGNLDTAGAPEYRALLAHTYAAEAVLGLRTPDAFAALESAVYYMDMLKQHLPADRKEAV